jgi:ABC-type Fe3+-hydroxamate transport system substrate-binding protein
LTIVALAASLPACAAPPARTQAPDATRIVALVPSIAEDLYAVGAGPQVVAVSSFTDVRASRGLRRVADFTSVDTEAIVALHATLVIGIPAQERLVEPLKRAGVNVVLLADDSYDDIFGDLRAVGKLSGRPREAAAAIANLQRETAAIHARTRGFKRRPSVFVVLGSGPIWTAGSGSYIGTLIALAGGTNAAANLHAPYGEYGAESLLQAQPDVLVTDPAIHLEAVIGREPWRSLRAVRDAHVYSVNPASMIERPGPNYNEGLHWLVERLTPLAT